MQYRKKPVVIDAIQLTRANAVKVYEWVHDCTAIKTDMDLYRWDDYLSIIEHKGMKIPTLEGEMIASMGDYIIKGIQGEFYPCKPDIFEATYEAVA
jgi:hypothetical protein